MTPFVHCLVGLSGAGKTTLRRELEARGALTFGKDGGDRNIFYARLVELLRSMAETSLVATSANTVEIRRSHLVVELNTGRRSWTIRQLKALGYDVRVYMLEVDEPTLRRNREARRAGRKGLAPVRLDLSVTFERTNARAVAVAKRWGAFRGTYEEVKAKLAEDGV
jgi:hypothetical protein